MEKSPFSKVDQIGVIVRNLEKAIEYYESLGIGPFEPLKGVVSVKRWIKGKEIDPAMVKLRVSVAKMGSVDFELIEPGGGETLWQEFLDTHGEGINHLGFIVDDIEKESARIKEKGVKPIYESRFQGGGGACYFDTAGVGGVLFELIEWPPK